MDITTVEGSGEVLFADIMATGEESQRLQEKAEKREKKGPRISKPRPVSFPAGSAYSKSDSISIYPSGTDQSISRRGYGSISSLFGKGFPFSKPKAFFSSEQHLSGRVDGYNRNREQLYQLKALATSLVSKRVRKPYLFCLLLLVVSGKQQPWVHGMGTVLYSSLVPTD